MDYIKPGSPFTIRWTNVFIGDSKVMDKFRVYLSTYPGGMCRGRTLLFLIIKQNTNTKTQNRRKIAIKDLVLIN